MTLTWRLDESLKLTLYRMLPKVLAVTAVSSPFANMHTNIAENYISNTASFCKSMRFLQGKGQYYGLIEIHKLLFDLQ